MKLMRQLLMVMIVAVWSVAAFAEEAAKPAMPGLSIPLGGGAAETKHAADVPKLESAGTSGSMAMYYGKKFSRGPKSKPRVVLTFDDGPAPKTTPQVIEILQKNEVRATFFMLGSMVQASPGTAKLVADAGMEIGSHSMSHANLAKLGEDKVQHEIVDAAQIVAEVTSQPQHLFRPPYGNINRNVTKTATDNSLVMCLWTVDTRDWAPMASTSKIVSTVMNETRNGSVILLHDIHQRSVDAVPEIIKGLKEKGFEFVTLGEMIEAAATEPPEADAASGGDKNAAPAKPLAISLDESSKY